MEKVIIICPDCHTSLRFPILETLIRFNCKKCGRNFKAQNGKVVESNGNSEEYNFVRDDIPRKSFFVRKQLLIWRLLSGFLFCLLVVLLFMFDSAKKDKSHKDDVTRKIMKAINMRGEKSDFKAIKKFLTPETQEIFSAFIESQYVYRDSIGSIKIVDSFFNTLSPLEYDDRRKFMYTIGKDTSYFYVEYIKDIESNIYLIDVKISEFVK